MSQADPMSGFEALSMPSQAASSYQVHGCRWSWCRDIFATNAELVQHVMYDHVRRAIPVKKSEIPFLKRAEAGIGANWSMSAISEFPSETLEEDGAGDAGKEDFDHSQPKEPPSSLPSPPASSPPSLAPIQSPEPEDVRSSPIQEVPFTASLDPISQHEPPQSPSSARLRLSSPQANLQPPSNYPHGDMFATPTFGSMSSPIASGSSLPANPGSPSFNSMVENVMNGKKRKARDESTLDFPSKTRNYLPDEKPQSQDSQMSSDSQDSVKRQLTQSVEDDDRDYQMDDLANADDDHQISTHGHEHTAVDSSNLVMANTESSQPSVPTSNKQPVLHVPSQLSQPPSQLRLEPHPPVQLFSPSQSQLHSPVNLHIQTDFDSSPQLHLSPSSLSSPAPAFAVSTPVQRQAWYQPPPRRRRKSERTASLGSQSGVATASTPPHAHVSVPSQSAHARTKFRSGTLQITPAPILNTMREKTMEDSLYLSQIQQSQKFSQSQEEWSQSQDNPQEPSYPGLQTQAPYQSQSLSQM